MKHPNYVVAIIFLLIAYSVNGQSDFRPGYYINYQSDTIFGEISYRGDLHNSKSCVYKPHGVSEEIKFLPEDIAAYRFIGSKYFISKQIDKNQDSERMFLEYLVNGIANLYYYRDQEGDHYLLENKDGHLSELTSQMKIIEKHKQEYWAKDYAYVGLLKASFADCMEIQPQLDKAVLNHKSLINITEDYHNYICTDEKCIVYQKEIPAIRVRVGPSLGLSLTNLEVLNSQFYEKFDFEPDYAPTLGLIVNMEAPRINEKLLVQLEADFVKNNFHSQYQNVMSDGSVYTYQANASTTTIRSAFALKYRICQTKIRPTLGVGPSINYLLKKDFGYATETPWNNKEFEDDPLEELTIGWYVTLGADIKLRGNIEAYLNLKYIRTSATPVDITKFQIVSLHTGVYF